MRIYLVKRVRYKRKIVNLCEYIFWQSEYNLDVTKEGREKDEDCINEEK